MNRSRIVVAVAVVCCFAGAGTAALGRRDRGRERLPEWVRIGGQSYAGRTPGEVSAALERQAAEQVAAPLVLVVSPPDARRRMWTVPRKALGASVDVQGMVRAAFAAANSEGWWAKVKGWMGRREAARIPILWRVDTATAGRYLTHVVKPVVTRPATSARLRLVGGVPQVAPDSPGLTLDVAASVPIVSRAVLAEQSDPLALPMVSSSPTVAAADATGITDEIARFQTLFSERGNRRTNLVLACARINGTIVKPGGVFSYNETVGPRVAEAGFRMAPVIVRGRMEPGMGGGICQVSSTLYNAAMLAGMGTVARSHHAFPVHYLPPGRDATVAYGSIDLKVRNTTDGAVGFLADASDGRVTIRVFGTPLPGRAVSIERTGVSSWAAPVRTVSDPSLPAGKSVVRDRGHAGHRVSVWRIVREGGRTVKRELLSRDTYRAFPRIIARGPAPAAPPDAGVLSPARASDPPDTPGSDL